MRIHVAASATDACTANVPIRLINATTEEPDSKKPIPSDSIVDAAIGTADFDFGVVADRSGTAKEGPGADPYRICTNVPQECRQP